MFMFCGKSRGIKMVGFFRFFAIYLVDTIVSLMGRLFCWGGSTSVSTTGTLETT